MPYRIDPDGVMRVILITSRDTRRWVVPKGNRMRGFAPHEAAAQEAWEEAGVRGISSPVSLGAFRYMKRRRSGAVRQAVVDLYPIKFIYQTEDWPERRERDFRWFTLDEAARAVDEPDLRALITHFRIPPPQPGVVERMVPIVRSRLSEVIPMLRWFQALMPSQGRFFEQFESHAAMLVAGAEALALLLQGGADMPTHIKTIVDREHDADDITREVLQDVRRIFVTPFDRSAITGLIGVMDDAIDQMNKTAKAIELYGVTSFEPQMRDMTGIIVEAARITVEAIPLLRSLGSNSARLHDLTERLITIEGHADEIHDNGIKALFKASGGDALGFVVGRELYSHLERIVDRFEDVANEIQGLVIDHA